MKNTPIIRNTNLRFNPYPPIFLHLILIIYQKNLILQDFLVEYSKNYGGELGAVAKYHHYKKQKTAEIRKIYGMNIE